MQFEGYGVPQPIQDVSECRRSAFDFVQLLTGVRECNCRRQEGKISFADSDHITNFSPPQHINMPISMLMSFIVTSVRVTS